MLASVLYKARFRSSKRSSPLTIPRISSHRFWRCCSSTGSWPPTLSCREYLTSRFHVRLEFFAAESFLAKAFGNRQFKGQMGVAGGEATVFSSAAVTNEGVSNPNIEKSVKCGRAQED